jgi:signal transduction histidine kinase
MGPIRILVVENESFVAFDLRQSLQRLEHEVVAMVSTGKDAILQAEVLSPDLILMDIQLDGEMDGIEAAQQIQAKCQIPIIYLTASTDPVTLGRIAASQPYGYMLKPISPPVLATHIEIALTRNARERAVQQALASATRAAQQQAESLAIASHEIRTPIGIIILTTDVMERMWDQLSTENRQLYLERIRNAANTLSFLLEDCLFWGKISSETWKCSLAELEVVRVCEEQIRTWQFTADCRCNLCFFSSANNCIACLDEHLLWHLLNNLLSNAVKYSPLGGTVCLTLNCDETSLEIQVQDQGIGIPAEDLGSLFNPYHRAHNVGEIPGTGLGLAIAKRCVDLHQGQITVNSQVSQGTTVNVRLPR